MLQLRQLGFWGVTVPAPPFLNPRSPAMNASSICGINFSASIASPYVSVELLVSSAKRDLAKPEQRIQLDELFAQETNRLLDQLDGEIFSAQGQWRQEGFCARVQQYESVTEPLARMAGVLGRWGDGKWTAPGQVDELRLSFEHRRSS